MKRATSALPEVIPPRICITFRRASFWFQPKSSKIEILDRQPGNTTNTKLGSRDNFSENHKIHAHRSKLDPYSTNRAENQAFWISKVLPSQWDHWGPPKLGTALGKEYTNYFRQPDVWKPWSVLGLWAVQSPMRSIIKQCFLANNEIKFLSITPQTCVVFFRPWQTNTFSYTALGLFSAACHMVDIDLSSHALFYSIRICRACVQVHWHRHFKMWWVPAWRSASRSLISRTAVDGYV